MRFERFSFGTIRIDGSTCEYDVVIDRGEVRKREKGPSKQFSDASGHTPLSIEEKIPWKCRQLIIGTGAYNQAVHAHGAKRRQGHQITFRYRTLSQRRLRSAE